MRYGVPQTTIRPKVPINKLLNVLDPESKVSDGSDASPEENAKTMIFLPRHIHEALKNKYVVIDEPLVLWKALCERYNHQKMVTLPRARYEWTHLRFQDFKTVSDTTQLCTESPL
ncbi:hypothetical protein L3X38_024418 [Prunus dulcis]|uniref:Uncharacterized protein n=1 Tax=Prunus dulcis TaxID=3755 RepID=A0AAD4Z650_PRUDU|nr:hypothetical protein L3X38_024418 [Prunus dulcis]